MALFLYGSLIWGKSPSLFKSQSPYLEGGAHDTSATVETKMANDVVRAVLGHIVGAQEMLIILIQ